MMADGPVHASLSLQVPVNQSINLTLQHLLKHEKYFPANFFLFF